MSYIFFGGEQAFDTSLGFPVIAIDIYENLRGPAIVGHMNGSDPNQTYARIGEFAFHQRFDFLAQSFT
jgi:hypothetical protein